jgi:hypothetical protein
VEPHEDGDTVGGLAGEGGEDALAGVHHFGGDGMII